MPSWAMRASLLGAMAVVALSGCQAPDAAETSDLGTIEASVRPSPADGPSGPGTIVFSAMPSPDDLVPQLFAIGGDGTGLRQLTSDDSLKTAIAWSPDGSQVAYTSLRMDHEREPGELIFTSIYTIAPDGSGKHLVCKACTRTLYTYLPAPNSIDMAGGGNASVPDALTWSPDGTRLAAPASSNGLLVVDVASGSTTVIGTGEPVTAVTWSPDGRTVAASHTWFLIPPSALGAMTPPSGTQVEYGTEERPGGIYLIDVDSRSVEEIVATNGLAHVHGWSSDGSTLAYTRIAGGGKAAELAAYSVEQGRSWPLIPGERGSADQGAGWSPHGGQIAALIDQFDEEHRPILWTASSSGSVRQSFAACDFTGAVQGQCYVPTIAWSPDGRAVAYRASIQHAPLIHVLVVQQIGSGEPQLLDLPKLFPDYVGGYCCLAWHATNLTRP